MSGTGHAFRTYDADGELEPYDITPELEIRLQSMMKFRAGKMVEHLTLKATKVCDSPIEAAFLMAFELYPEVFKVWPPMEIAPQFRIGHHRVDFMAICPSTKRRAVVECDGAEFHVDTDADEVRDAELRSLGYRVFRFTGSELHRDPFDCAREVLVWLAAKAKADA